MQAFLAFSIALPFFSFVVQAETLIRGPGFLVTDEMVEAELALVPPELASKNRSDPGHLESFINDLYNWRAIAQAAQRSQIDQDPDVRYRLERTRQRELVAVMLERQRAMAEEQAPDLTALADEHYRAHREDFASPERRRVRHILLKAVTPAEKERRRVEALAIQQRLQAGESFADLAQALSEDSGSAPRGGALGAVVRGRMVKPFEDAAFALDSPGEISDVVETRYGLHILLLEGVEPGQQKTFDEVKDQIISKLRVKHVEQAVEDWRLSVVDPAKAQVNQEAVDAFITRTVTRHNQSSAPP